MLIALKGPLLYSQHMSQGDADHGSKHLRDLHSESTQDRVPCQLPRSPIGRSVSSQH